MSTSVSTGHRVRFRPRHEWVENPEPTANFGSTGFTISHGGRSDEAPKRAEWCRNFRNPQVLTPEISQPLQNQVGWPQNRGVPHVTPGTDTIICFLRTWGLRYTRSFRSVRTHQPYSLRACAKRSRQERMILSQYLFLEKARQGKKRKNASNVSMVHTLLN